MKVILRSTYLLFREFKHSLLFSFFGIRCSCNHKPSCSQNMIDEIKNGGFLKGLFRGLKRILYCYKVAV